MKKVLSVLVAAAFVALTSSAKAQTFELSSTQSAAVSDAGQSITYGVGPYDTANMSSTLGE